MKQVLLVAKETYLRQVKSVAFLIMVLGPFFFLAFSVGIGLISGNAAADRFQMAVLFEEPIQKEDVSSLTDATFDYQTESDAQKALEDGEIVSYLTIQVKNQQVEAVFHSDSPLGETEKAQIVQNLSVIQSRLNIQAAGLTNEQLATLSLQPKISEKVETGKESENLGKMLSFYALIMVMYFIIILYSSSTAQEIANEKGTKIMEVIFSSVPASNYFHGRILGIFGVIMTHIGLYVIGGIAAYKSFENSDMLKGIKPLLDAVLQNLDWTLVGFATLGVLIYVVFAALCGSLVVRAEDANKAVSPVMYLVIAGFVGAMALGQHGVDNLLLKIGSYLPFISSFFMPIRVINGHASVLESTISLIVLAITTLLLIHYIGKSYAGLILQTDDLGFFKSLKRGFGNK
ncbi:ABC transporter permease [Streptococcus ovis]|uniref:ABC transporter permease n=1 Tax=Streptococcus ovis TaxID=82806 RepID=UPI00035DED0D|nr:ABC transporter permease [Streptococcus ovis]